MTTEEQPDEHEEVDQRLVRLPPLFALLFMNGSASCPFPLDEPVAHPRQPPVLGPRRALPVAAARVPVRVHLGIGVVAHPRRALGQPLCVHVVVREPGHNGVVASVRVSAVDR